MKIAKGISQVRLRTKSIVLSQMNIFHTTHGPSFTISISERCAE